MNNFKQKKQVLTFKARKRYGNRFQEPARARRGGKPRPARHFVAFIDSGTEGTLVQSDFMFAMIGNNT